MLERLDLRIVNITVVDPYERGFGSWEPQHRMALEVMRGGRRARALDFDVRSDRLGEPGVCGSA